MNHEDRNMRRWQALRALLRGDGVVVVDPADELIFRSLAGDGRLVVDAGGSGGRVVSLSAVRRARKKRRLARESA